MEGTFRLSCIDVMQTMRDNKEFYEIMLEHFVYDPLIDWRVQSGTHESILVPLYVIDPTLAAHCSKQKRKMELDSTFELFKLRTSELGPDWQENRKEMCSTVSQLKDVATKWSDLQTENQRQIQCTFLSSALFKLYT